MPLQLLGVTVTAIVGVALTVATARLRGAAMKSRPSPF